MSLPTRNPLYSLDNNALRNSPSTSSSHRRRTSKPSAPLYDGGGGDESDLLFLAESAWMEHLFGVLELVGLHEERRLAVMQGVIAAVGLSLAVREAWLGASFSQVFAGGCGANVTHKFCLTQNVASLLSPPVFFWAGIAAVFAWRGMSRLACDLMLVLALPALIAGLLWARCGFIGRHGHSTIQLSAMMQLQFLMILCAVALKCRSQKRKLSLGTSKRHYHDEYNTSRGRSSTLPRGWRLHQTSEGRMYFEHLRTGRVQTTLPNGRRASSDATAPPLRVPELIIEHLEPEAALSEPCSDYSPRSPDSPRSFGSGGSFREPISTPPYMHDVRLRSVASAPDVMPYYSRSRSARVGRRSRLGPDHMPPMVRRAESMDDHMPPMVRRAESMDDRLPLRQLLSAFKDADRAPDDETVVLLPRSASDCDMA